MRDGFAEDIGMAWVTKGNTIENYVPVAVLRDAVSKTHPSARLTWSGDPYVNPLAKLKYGPRLVDKIGVAKAVVDEWSATTPWSHDLRTRVTEVVRFIRAANAIREA